MVHTNTLFLVAIVFVVYILVFLAFVPVYIGISDRCVSVRVVFVLCWWCAAVPSHPISIAISGPGVRYPGSAVA